MADPVLDWVREWVRGNDLPKIRRATGSGGGWEVWAQVELYLRSNTPPVQNFTVQRELQVYGTDERVDHWLSPKVGFKGPFLGLELKCRTATEQSTEFAARMKKDMKYISHNPTRGQFAGSVMYAIGLTPYEVDTDLFRYIELGEDYPDHVHRERIVDGGHLASDIWMVWLKCEWNPRRNEWLFH